MTIPAPSLRIVDDDLWRAAHERLENTRCAYLRSTGGRPWGRPDNGIESPYLLTGMSSCAVCGASLFVRKRPDGRVRDRVYAYYGCSYHHHRGAVVCANGLQMLMGDADQAVLDVLRDKVLHPNAIALAMEMTAERYLGGSVVPADQRAGLETELRRIEQEIARLVEALASGQPLSSIQDAIRTREARKAHLHARLEHLDGIARAPSSTRLRCSATSANG